MQNNSIGINTLRYLLPKQTYTLNELKNKNLIKSEPSFLKEMGYRQSYYYKSEDEIYEDLKELIDSAIKSNPDLKFCCDYIFLYTGILNLYNHTQDNDLFNNFVFITQQLLHDAGLSKAQAIRLSEQGCSGALSSIDLATNYLKSQGEEKSILIINVDSVLNLNSREATYNLLSDAASCMEINNCSYKYEIIDFLSINQSSLWDTREKENEIIAAYFPHAKHVVEAILDRNNITIDDVSTLIPHNVNIKSWEILSDLIGIDKKKVYLDNIEKIGHTISSDHVINLVSANDQIENGAHVLVFTFGFGASWSSLLLRKK